MTSYTLNYADGSVSEIWADDDTQAEAIATNTLIDGHGYDDPVAADQWDAYGHNDDGQPMERLLFWECEEDAENDPGAAAIAYLLVVRS